mmetsp:Transcript_29675/g.66983  ORF Transcript_29675/g.66983 Transcript_29675/m.66983 type:complete len:269 (+) Transcript_29675:201-1007(+)
MEAPPGGARAASGDESESGRHDGQQAASETPQDDTPNSNRAAGSARSMDLEDEEANSEENVVPSMACHLLPHGLYVFLPASVALMAWLATLSKDDCDYAKVTGDIVAEITGSPEVPFVEVGFDHWRGPEHNGETDEWSINIAEPCQEINTDIIRKDGVWRLSKGMSYFSLILGGAGTLLVWCAVWFYLSREIWRWPGILLCSSALVQALTFSWFGSAFCKEESTACAMNYGARVDVLSCCLWMFSSLLVFSRYPRFRERVPSQLTGRG